MFLSTLKPCLEYTIDKRAGGNLKRLLCLRGEVAIHEEKADGQTVQGFASYVKI